MVRRRTARKKRSKPGCGSVVALLIIAATAAYVAWKAWTWPDVAALARENPKTTAFIEAWCAERHAAQQLDLVRRECVGGARHVRRLGVARERDRVLAEGHEREAEEGRRHQGLDEGDAAARADPPCLCNTRLHLCGKCLAVYPESSAQRDRKDPSGGLSEGTAEVMLYFSDEGGLGEIWGATNSEKLQALLERLDWKSVPRPAITGSRWRAFTQ